MTIGITNLVNKLQVQEIHLQVKNWWPFMKVSMGSEI